MIGYTPTWYKAEQGEARGCSTNSSVINSLIKSLSHPLVKIYLQRRHALILGDGAFSHKIDYGTIFKEILNLEGHPNCISGSKVMAISLNGWILSFCGASSAMIFAQPAKQACWLNRETISIRVAVYKTVSKRMSLSLHVGGSVIKGLPHLVKNLGTNIYSFFLLRRMI